MNGPQAPVGSLQELCVKHGYPMPTYDWPFVDVQINKNDILLDPSLGYSFSARIYSLHRAAWSSPQGQGTSVDSQQTH